MMPFNRFSFGLLAFILASMVAGRAAEPIPDKLREELKLDRFYQKHVDAAGLPVVGSGKVSDAALAEAAWIVGRMLDGREDLVRVMRGNRVRAVVMAATESTTDVPEHARLTPKIYWDRRARGLGATPANPAVSCGEENLLGFPGDPYPNENIFVHEFAHAIHGTGLRTTDPTFDRRLRAAHASALERGLWKNTYAATNHSEYWAEGAQCWFDDNAPPDALHNDVRTRAKLKEYDPALAKLCAEVFGDREWRYRRPADRKPEDRAHLKDYDPKKLPRFEWRAAPIGDKPRATIQTSAGDFDVELDAKAAREATALFLTIALDGGYHSARFRSASNGTAGTEPNAAWLERSATQLKLGEVPATVTLPKDGTIAMVRGGKLGAIAIFVGEPPEKNGDVVPFGRVVKGADTVKKLLAEAERTKSGVDIRRVIRTE